MRFDLVDLKLFLHVADARSITHAPATRNGEVSKVASCNPKAATANPTISLDIEERESADIAVALAPGAANVGIASAAALPAT